ncbi:hypothetical protein ABZ671_04565 [Micromonospora sp. NPDC006766]|uniref:hypothetical protein n=1 Tax=Micromonospora sp. NPDC006766 TaxID=3154778 RepID=UPI0033DD0009
MVAPLGPPPAEAAEAQQSQPVGYVIGNDGRLYDSSFRAPVISDVMAPPGAGLATFRESDGSLSAFAIGTQGGLVMTTPTYNRPGYTLALDGASGVAVPGAPLSAVSDRGSAYVFFVGRSGALFRAAYRQPARPSGGPQPISASGIAPSGGIVAAVTSPTSAPGVVFVGSNGALYSTWSTSSGAWTTVQKSPANVAQPGGGVAAVPTGSRVQVFFTGRDGSLWSASISAGPLPDPWVPVVFSQAGLVPSGASLAAARLSDDALAVLFAGTDGAIRVVANLNGQWQGPSAVTPAGVARPGIPLAVGVAGGELSSDWCGNDVLWWWRWRWPGPPPPLPWYGEISQIRVSTPGLVRDGFNVSLTL